MKYQIKDIKDFPGYRIDTNGDVWSCWKQRGRKGEGVGVEGYMSDKWRKLKASIHHSGYKAVGLSKNKKPHIKYIHRLVLEIFVGPCPKGMETCHNNGVRHDNRLRNLRWDTLIANQQDRIKHGTWHGGEKNSQSKLTEKQVRVIRWASHYGASQVYLAHYFNVTISNIHCIIKNKSWKHKSAQIT